ncbi:tRNA-processing RNAse BN [Desulfuromonas soudanensis]|uniref:tRNA-processing RNAse BN n=1 Tax=Desulfuromonas soudanensis TaxID=1603606 RepID=A0A0M4DJ44_9BACT|nr:YhjD/YihY/BrkB family envelope integrity protein [Desulfuromonas soudanensis]ALC17057.1 tRNA-processing RNAse BN [Desulfuromonas soudanensis]
MVDVIEKIKRFMRQKIWELDPRELTRMRLVLLRHLQVAVLVWRDFFADRCMLRASALTYTTMLAIVPLLALMFSVLKGLGVQNTLEPFILDKIAIGSAEIVSAIIAYINNTNFGRLGTVGLVALVLSVLALLSNIEEMFNHVWGVTETRSLFRRFSDYSSVVLIGPVFLLAAISMTTTLKSQTFIQTLMGMAYVGDLIFLLFKVLPYVVMWAAFTFLYLFMPNVKVQFRAALLGGIFGGTLWQLAQWGYLNFQVGVARYNAIYGTMAALPIFMVWIYLSWVIVLLGLEVTYSIQNLRSIRREICGEDVNFASRELVALTILLATAANFLKGERPWDLERITEELELPPRLARSILNELVKLGFLSVVHDAADNDNAYQPARSPEAVSVHGVVQALKEDGASVTRLRRTVEWKTIAGLEADLDVAGREALGNLTLKDLVLKMEGSREKKEESG